MMHCGIYASGQLFNGPFQSCARDLVLARLTMYHGIVLGDANMKSVPDLIKTN